MKAIKIIAALGVVVSLSACETLLNAQDIFSELAEKGDAISDAAIQKAADGYDLYCDKVPTSVQQRINARFNEATKVHDMPKWCE